jgi:hypothetical protein
MQLGKRDAFQRNQEDRFKTGPIAHQTIQRVASEKQNPNPSRAHAVRADLIGSDTCTANGLTARGPAPVLALCRILIQHGHNTDDPMEVYRNGTLSFRVASLREGARFTVEDDKMGRPRFRLWRERRGGAASPSEKTRPDGPVSISAIERQR